MNPIAYIIAGPNGAGKTTFAREFLPRFAECKNFINADLIAQGISPFSPESAAVRAGKVMFEEIDLLAHRRVDFGFETTLSGRAHVKIIDRLKAQGYGIKLFYLWLPSPEAALSRVRDRAYAGGHDIAEEVVRRRYDRSIRNFLVLYRDLADEWILFNNSSKSPAIIALVKGSKLRKIDGELFDRISKRYGDT